MSRDPNDLPSALPRLEASPPIVAAIFDLDGTLVDSEPVYADNDRAFFARYGVEFDEALETELFGKDIRDTFLAIQERHPESPLGALSLEERIRLKDEEFLVLAAERVKVFPAMISILRDLSSRGIRMGVASGSSLRVVETVLKQAGIRDFFAAVLSSSDLTRGKPDPELFLEAARRLGAKSSACLVFEDSRFGVLAARRAGMRCVALPPPGPLHPDFGLADILVEGGPAALDPESLMDTLRPWF